MAGDKIAEFAFPSAVRGFLAYRGVWVPSGRSTERGGSEARSAEARSAEARGLEQRAQRAQRGLGDMAVEM